MTERRWDSSAGGTGGADTADTPGADTPDADTADTPGADTADTPDADTADTPGSDRRVCSAKGCRLQSTWALRWNNPRIHQPERRKVWLACDAHREYLESFLDRRGFLREIDPFDPAR